MSDEVNFYIATEIMGLCWHEWINPEGRGFKIKLTCPNCGNRQYRSNTIPNPKYDSDASPRELLNEALRTFGDYDAVAAFLTNEIYTDDQILNDDADSFMWLSATAGQLSNALVAAHKASGEGE